MVWVAASHVAALGWKDKIAAPRVKDHLEILRWRSKLDCAPVRGLVDDLHGHEGPVAHVVVECLFVEQQGLAMMASSAHTLRTTKQGRVAQGAATTEQSNSMPDVDCQEQELQSEAGH